MVPRFGLGPVFALECLALPRRWQVYVGRVVFVGLLFAGLYLLWETVGTQALTINQMQAFNTRFFSSVVVIQFLVVMLAAPAVTAGSICVDKARGTLHHVFVTDLTNREVILGKLGGRLLTILALMACGAPVLALGGLLGGFDYQALLRAYAITAGMAVLACTLALYVSIWVRKPHQAMLPVYAIFGAWVGFGMLDLMLNGGMAPFSRGGTDSFRWWVEMTNPVLAALATYTDDDATRWIQPLAFLAVTLGLSGLLLMSAIRQVRRVVINQANRAVKRQKADAPIRILDYLPGPPLDGNPILWREWHRKRPTRWTGRFWTLYAVLSLLASGFVIFVYFTNPVSRDSLDLAAFVNGVEVAIGLLLLTISATSSLAEERDRGSLDVIMTTPLSTASILRGKWCGTFAMVPRLAILPLWVSSGLALVTGQFLAPCALLGLILAYSAFITSLGLALAIWVPRLGRAIGTGIALVLVLMTTLWLAHGYMMRINGPSDDTGAYAIFSPNGTVVFYRTPFQRERPDWDWLMLANPYVGASEITLWSGRGVRFPWMGQEPPVYALKTNDGYGWVLVWIAILAGLSLWLLLASIASFDRLFDRMTTDIRLNSPVREDPRLPAYPNPTSASAFR
jgi:ABC-type transport system involved in multi-copper enzyme maturation permease subunit